MRNRRYLNLVVALAFFGTVTGCGHEDENGEHHHSQQAGSPAAPEHKDNHQQQESHSHEHGHEHGDQDTTEMRQTGAHLHGDANLAIAVEGNILFIEFDTPVYNLTGFEFSPKTNEEQAELKRVESVLSLPADLFSINTEAACKAVRRAQSVSLNLAGEHESEESHAQTHKDVIVEYQFRCDEPKSINEITVKLFEEFPLIEELDLVYIDQSNQRSMTLNPNSFRLNLAR